MNFSEALDHIKAGAHLQRAEWNDKGVHVLLGKCSPNDIQGSNGFEMGPDISSLYIRTAFGNLMVWTPNQADLLAEDWCVVRPT